MSSSPIKKSTRKERNIAKFKIGKNVAWKWPPGYVTGVVQEIYFESVSRKIKDRKVTRHGTKENPAYLLLTKKGVHVLKLESELFDHTDITAV